MIEITDLDAPELAPYAKLNEAQLLHLYEPNGGAFIAESPMVIERALDAGCIPISILAEKRLIEGNGKNIIERCMDIPVYTAQLEVLNRITGYALTRGMLCAMHRPELPTVEAVCSGAKRIAILENVMNPTNVGAIFRSAAALDMDGILLTPASSNPLYRRAIRVSMGTVFQIPWTITDAQWKINDLHKLGFKTAAMALKEDAVSIDDPHLAEESRLAIVLGTERDGLAADTIANCDYTARIPMSHGVDSLNVAAASAVAFWQLGRASRRMHFSEPV